MLYEIIYYSTAVSTLSQADLDQIFKSSKEYNEEHDITGCLLFHNNHFLQVLEGNRDELEILEHKIMQDPRHSEVEVLERGEISRRMYPTWTMALNDVQHASEQETYGIIDLEEFVDLSNFTRKSSTAKNLFWTLSQELLDEVDQETS